MKNLKEEFGNKLKNLRKSKNYTQEVFAEKIDLSQRQLIRIENGRNFPSIDTINKMMQILDVDLGKLFDFKSEGKRPLNTDEMVTEFVDAADRELYNKIIAKIKIIASNKKKLKYLKLAIDALYSKEALEELKIFIKGMDINS